ncbi:MAG TPA: TIGR01777 family oxidoreductase [Miltoncostaeaceae bacterium]|nr:TIGR01777 family oxidoreductase [Miltoncostaeaceae bacterium]
MRVAVVGATGMIGGAVARALLARGDEVVAVSRRGRAGLDGAEDVRWDPAEGAPPPAALEADAVVNAAGSKNDLLPWTVARKREYHESRVGTTRLLAGALDAGRGPRVLVNASGADYYGPREEPADEGAPPGSTFLAGLCVAWEREASRAEERGLRVVRLRTGVVLSTKGGALPQLARPVRLFAGGPIGGGRQWLPWIHVDDHVGLNLRALDDDRLSGPVNAAAPGIVRQREFVKDLARVLGRPAVLPTPAIALRLALGEKATLALDSRHIVPRAALQAGYEFRFAEAEPALRDLLG